MLLLHLVSGVLLLLLILFLLFADFSNALYIMPPPTGPREMLNDKKNTNLFVALMVKIDDEEFTNCRG